MQKPPYFKIFIPTSKKFLTPQVKKLFKSLLKAKAEIRFSNQRQRKSFYYSIAESEPQVSTSFFPTTKHYDIILVFSKQ